MSSPVPASFLGLLDRAGPHTVPLLAEEQVLFLGEDFLPWMVLAFGAALVVGNALALFRPPNPNGASRGRDTEGSAPKGGGTKGGAGADEQMERPPIARTVVMIVVGLVAAGWGLASLLS